MLEKSHPDAKSQTAHATDTFYRVDYRFQSPRLLLNPLFGGPTSRHDDATNFPTADYGLIVWNQPNTS